MLDMNKSEEKFIAITQKELSEKFPNTQIDLRINKKSLTMIDGIISHPGISHVNMVIENIIKKKRLWVTRKIEYSFVR